MRRVTGFLTITPQRSQGLGVVVAVHGIGLHVDALVRVGGVCAETPDREAEPPEWMGLRDGETESENGPTSMLVATPPALRSSRQCVRPSQDCPPAAPFTPPPRLSYSTAPPRVP